MDTELLKAIGPLLGGLLALAGGAFTFVNGRLRDAETQEDKNRLLSAAATWIALAPTLAAVLFMFLGAKFYVAVALFVLSYVLQARIFLLKGSPPTRAEILTFSALSGVTAASVVFAITGSLLERVIDNQARMLQVQEQTIELLQKQNSIK
jgi:predicted membrane-bound mannosyltransferase